MSQQPQQAKYVGVVGAAASGKNTVADIFAEHGYTHVSSSDKVREEIAERQLVTSRKLQNTIANEMRALHGPGYWIDRSLAGISAKDRLVVISGLYAVGEGVYIKEQLGGKLVGVKLDDVDDPMLRYERTQARSQGHRDDMTQDDFMAAYRREHGGSELYEANVDQLLLMADFVIYNSGTLAMLHQQVRSVLQTIGGNE